MESLSLVDTQSQARDLKAPPHSSESCLAQNLPFDVLGEIFSFCLPEDFRLESQMQLQMTSVAPMLLCQICFHWRQVALSTSKIWTQFAIRVKTMDCPSQVQLPHRVGTDSGWEVEDRFSRKNSHQLLRWWKKLLGSLPLSMSLELLQTTQEDSSHADLYLASKLLKVGPSYYPALSSMLSSAQTLDLKFCFHQLDIISSFPKNTFNNLEHLTIHLDTTCTQSGRMVISPFPLAPRLRRLHLSDSILLKIFTKITAEQITHLCIAQMRRVISYFQFVNILKTLPNLICGTFAVDPPPLADPPPTATPLLSIPNLRQLVLLSKRFSTPTVLHGLLFPSLISLRVIPIFYVYFPTLTDFTNLIATAPNLKELHLDSTLFRTPSLNLKADDADERPIRLDILLPHLYILVLEIAGLDESREGELMSLIQSQWFRPVDMGRLELVVYKNLKVKEPATLSTSDSEPAESVKVVKLSIVEKLDAYVDRVFGNDQLDFNVIVKHILHQKVPFFPFEWSRDLARWEKAMGFYERGSSTRSSGKEWGYF